MIPDSVRGRIHRLRDETRDAFLETMAKGGPIEEAHGPQFRARIAGVAVRFMNDLQTILDATNGPPPAPEAPATPPEAPADEATRRAVRALARAPEPGPSRGPRARHGDPFDSAGIPPIGGGRLDTE